MTDNKKMMKAERSDLMNFFLYQDKLMWSRLQTIGVIEIATLSASYSLKNNGIISVSIIAFGTMLLSLVFYLLKYDEKVRDKINDILEMDYSVREYGFPIRGRHVSWIIYVSMLLLNTCFAVILVWHVDWI